MITHYGQTDSEKLADEKRICRQIVAEISNFGISQRQQLFLIYLLSLELEDVEKMKSLTSFIRDIGHDEVFIIDRADEQQETDV